MWAKAFRVGTFLARRQIRRTNVWSTMLIILIMVLTFLNLTVVSGILIGLPEGASLAYRTQYSADILISAPPEKREVGFSPEIISVLSNMPEVKAYTPRYLMSGIIEANYREKARITDVGNEVRAPIAGIDPLLEDAVTGMGYRLVEGEYLSPDDEDQILVGSRLLAKYIPPVLGEKTLKDVASGSKVRLKIGNTIREVTIKGVLESKIQLVGQRIYMNSREVRAHLGRGSYDVDEIAIKLHDPAKIGRVVSHLKSLDVTRDALIQTWEESQGPFFKDITTTFALLGDMTGSFGLMVAAITVFIVIFINAITRRKYIGILKGIGIHGLAIEISYIMQSLFYALIGSAVGLALLYGVIKPYIDVNPINFPFSEGLLVVPLETVTFRIVLLVFSTVIAGYIPARIVVKGNTLDAILGR